jgi:hypothetical protein
MSLTPHLPGNDGPEIAPMLSRVQCRGQINISHEFRTVFQMGGKRAMIQSNIKVPGQMSEATRLQFRLSFNPPATVRTDSYPILRIDDAQTDVTFAPIRH